MSQMRLHVLVFETPHRPANQGNHNEPADINNAAMGGCSPSYVASSSTLYYTAVLLLLQVRTRAAPSQ
jgi:hypothetical protein